MKQRAFGLIGAATVLSKRNAAAVLALLVGFALLAAVACEEGTSKGGSAGGGVDWSNYAPSVRTRIDSLAATRDCSGLQREFDLADANDRAQRSRTGTGNADLMRYIDNELRGAGCYD